MKLFIDFDNTIANSSEVIVDMLNEHFDKNENFEKLRKYDFSSMKFQSLQLEQRII